MKIRIVYAVSLLLIFFNSCTAQDNNSNEKSTALTREEIWEEFASLPAPKEVQKDIDTLFSDSLKSQILKTTQNNRYFQVDFKLKDSVVVEAYARYRPNDLSKELCDEIGAVFIGRKPTYKFIKRYDYGHYSFVVDKQQFR